MERQISLEDISDGKLYTLNDMEMCIRDRFNCGGAD